MLEQIIILAIVAIAFFYTIKKLAAQAKGDFCNSCSCKANKKLKKLVRLNQSMIDNRTEQSLDQK